MNDVTQTQAGGFIRNTGHSMVLGKIVAYGLTGTNFRIIISREGIQLQGMLMFPVDGARVLADMLKMAAIHVEHLASFKPDEAQTILEDSAVEDKMKTWTYPGTLPFNRPTLVRVN